MYAVPFDAQVSIYKEEARSGYDAPVEKGDNKVETPSFSVSYFSHSKPNEHSYP